MAEMRLDEASAESPGWETIEELFTVLEAPLLGYALRYTGEIGLAEDVVQEAFMKLHAQFGQVEKPRQWLYRTVHNLALNLRRASGRTVSLDASLDDSSVNGAPAADPVDSSLLPDEQIIRLEGIGLVRISLAALDDRSRELVRLKFTEELSYKDIAARTGLTATNVGYILHQALKTIAGELAKTGVVP
jgi:RNA polymerase sigma factor (sigma-70 family)